MSERHRSYSYLLWIRHLKHLSSGTKRSAKKREGKGGGGGRYVSSHQRCSRHPCRLSSLPSFVALLVQCPLLPSERREREGESGMRRERREGG